MPMPSFFGGRRRAFPFDPMNPILTQTQKPDIPTGEVTTQSGVRGLFTRKSLPNTLNVIGAGLRQMDGGNELDDFLANQQQAQYQRDMFGLRAAQGKREDDETERTRQERLAALAALPENLRPIAPLLTPEAISGAVMPPVWQPIPQGELPPGARFGQRNARTGEQDLEWTPQGAGGAGSVPSGYRATADGGLEAIPGGPADVRNTAEGRARVAQLESSEMQLQRAENAVTRALPLVNAGTTGVIAGGVLRGVNQGATDLYETLEPVRSVLAFETLQEMRRNSQTGGALGSIAVRELELLASVYESLNTTQSEGAMRGALQRLQTQLRRSIAAIRAARQEAAGGQQAPAGGGDGVRVIELEPE